MQLSRRRRMITRKFAVMASGLALALTLGACAGEGAGSGGDDGDAANGGDNGEVEEGGLIGVAMPTRSSERWIADGANVKEQLESLGYEVDLQYAEDDIPTQVNQLRSEPWARAPAKVPEVAATMGTQQTAVITARSKKVASLA